MKIEQKMLQMEFIRRQLGADLVYHSDRGSEYASASYQAILHQYCIHMNMIRKGNCYDNAMMGTFLGTLKEECVRERIFPSQKEARTDIFDYIEIFYNQK